MNKIIPLLVGLTLSLNLWSQILSPEMDMTDPLQREVLRLIPIMEARIGRTLPMPVVIWNFRRALSTELDAERADAEANAAAWVSPAYIGVDGKWERDLTVPPINACLIQFSTWGYSQTGAVLTTILSHEIYHCFQFSLVGFRAATSVLPTWVIEGQAAFAGQYFADGSVHDIPAWQDYLSGAQAISSMSYGSIGVWATVHDIDARDVFEFMDNLVSAHAENSWLKLSTLLSPSEKANVASKAKRFFDWGPNYDINFPEIPNGVFIPSSYEGELDPPQETPAIQSMIRHHRYSIPANKVIQIATDAGVYGRIRIMKGDGTEVLDLEITPSNPVKICRGERCGCPSGNPAYDVFNIDNEAVALNVFITGFENSNGKINFNEVPPGCCPGSRSLDPRFVGTWELDINEFTEAAKPPTSNPVTAFSRGNHTTIINSTGEIVRSGDIKLIYNWTENQGRYTLKETRFISSRASGCFESKSTGGFKGMFKHFNLSETSYHSQITRRNNRISVNQSHDEEFPTIRWGTGTSGSTGAYEFSPDGRTLKIRGQPRTYLKTSE